jgi:hypothetical protein
MGRAQAAYGPSLDHSCSFDRFATQDVFDDGGAHGVRCVGVTAGRGVLPSLTPPPATPPSAEAKAFETDQEVVLWSLWHQLSREDQVRFGDCFSRMILKILKRSDCLRGETGV